MASYKRRRARILILSGLSLIAGSPVLAQSGAIERGAMTQGAERPVRLAFEVATIKPIDPNASQRFLHALDLAAWAETGEGEGGSGHPYS